MKAIEMSSKIAAVHTKLCMYAEIHLLPEITKA